MDPFHERLAIVGLTALGRYGFALAGGYAVQAHGILVRPSEDVDLFTTLAAEQQFPEAVQAAIRAFESDGLDVEVAIQNAAFAKLQVTDPTTDRSSKVELGIDWRRHPPTTLAVGPVLSRDDAVANKVSALYSRGQARDYIDVASAVSAGAYTRQQLIVLATDHDPGFNPGLYAQALRAVRRLPRAEFHAYGLSDEQIDQILTELLSWAQEIDRTI